MKSLTTETERQALAPLSRDGLRAACQGPRKSGRERAAQCCPTRRGHVARPQHREGPKGRAPALGPVGHLLPAHSSVPAASQSAVAVPPRRPARRTHTPPRRPAPNRRKQSPVSASASPAAWGQGPGACGFRAPALAQFACRPPQGREGRGAGVPGAVPRPGGMCRTGSPPQGEQLRCYTVHTPVHTCTRLYMPVHACACLYTPVHACTRSPSTAGPLGRE